MKILFAINDLGSGGAEKTLVKQANFFSSRGDDVYFLTFLKKEVGFYDQLEIKPQNQIFIQFDSYFSLGFWKKLIYFLRKEKFDVIISALYLSNLLVRVASLFIYKVRILVREANLPNEKTFINRLVDRILSYKTEYIICPSEAVKKSLILHGISKNKPVVIYNGVEKDWFNVVKDDDIKMKYNIAENGVILASVGSLTPKKGHKYLIEAVCKLQKKVSNVYLLLIGAGSEEKKLKDLINIYNIEKNVKLIGRQNSIDIKNILSQSDIFVLPSLWEGLPNAMLEAMALGMPIVASSVGGVPEIIENNSNGLLVSPGSCDDLVNKMLILIKDKELSRVIGQKAKETAEKYTWEENFRKLASLLDKK